MSLISKSRFSDAAMAVAAAPITPVEESSEPSLYLTDGIELYRFLGAAASGFGEMVELEDCRSLAVAVVPIGDLRARRLRVVTPSDD